MSERLPASPKQEPGAAYGAGQDAAFKKQRLAVLISGTGGNLQAIIDAVESGRLPHSELVLVICNNASAQGIQRALKHRIPLFYWPWQKFPVNEATREMTPNEVLIAQQLHLFQVDLIVLAGWMRIFSAPFLELFAQRVLNVHPALLPPTGIGDTYTLSTGQEIPVFRGMHCVSKALEAGVPITGCSVHYVTPAVDAGPVICQQEVAIEPGDTEDSLYARIKAVEHLLLVEAIRQLSC